MPILGTAGDDNIAGTIGNDTFDLSQGGNDHASALGGDDIFQFGATFDALDSVSGGDGSDQLTLNGNYGDGLTITGAMMQSIEKIQLIKAFDYALTLDNDALTIGHTLTVDASNLKIPNFLLFDGTRETTSGFIVTTGRGNDVVFGGAVHDDFDLSLGGTDEAHGGGGNDIVRLGTAFDALDVIDGGDGRDTVQLDGDYSAGLVLAADSLIDVENLQLLAQAGAIYDLTIGDENIPSGGRLRIDASALGSGQQLRLDISQVDGGAVAGARIALLGGAEQDIVDVGALITEDRLNAGGGVSDLLRFNADCDVVLGNGTVQGFESLVFMPGHDYRVVAAGQTITPLSTLIVTGETLGPNDRLIYDGSATKTGQLEIRGGHGDDVLSGGVGNDSFDLSFGGDDAVNGGRGDNTFLFAGAFRASDSVDGGSVAGFNTVILDGDYSAAGLLFGADTMRNVDRLELHGTGSYAIALAPETLTLDAAFTVDASTVAVAGSVLLSAESSNGNITLIGHDGEDIFYAGTRFNTFDGKGGDDDISVTVRDPVGAQDVFLGGDGDDIFRFGGPDSTATMKSVDLVNGGNGTDLVILEGDYAAGLTFGAAALVDVERIFLRGVHAYKLTTNNATVGAGKTLTVDGLSLDSNGTEFGTLNFNGAAETDGFFTLAGGVGKDTLKGGALADSLRGRAAADTLTGGGGADTFLYVTAAESTGPNYDTITDANFSSDKFNVVGTVTTIDPAKTGGISSATFDANLASITAGFLGGTGHAILVAATSGTLNGHVFLVIDQNGTAGYAAGGDLVLEVTGASGTLATSTFI